MQHQTTKLFSAAGLVGLVLLTRIGHFGSLAMPPDATLAALFVGGFALRSWAGFALLAGAAVGADAIAFSGGASAACFTPGYALLLPAHLAVYQAGRLAARLGGGVLASAACLALGVGVFFVVSNAGFYAFSEHAAAMGPAEYASRVIRWLPPYLGVAAAYVAAAGAASLLVRHFTAQGEESRS